MKDSNLQHIIVLLSLCIFPVILSAEGTREVAPNGIINIDGNITNDIAALHINHPEYDLFAAWDGTDPASRMHINIQDPSSECIYLGFSYGHLNANAPDPPPVTYRFRILDPNGQVVYGPITVSQADANITSWSEGFNGPNVFSGAMGYDPFLVTSADLTSGGWSTNGDYYIEFENLDNDNPLLIDYWDITVADCSGASPEEKKGRVWSSNWAFFAVNDYGFPNRPFNGAFYVCAPDLISPEKSFITRINFDQAGFRPAAFNVVFNSFGTGNTGNIQEDRKSVENDNVTVPEYAVYLNDPTDICETAETGELQFSSIDRCGNDDYCINVISTQGGQVDILLDFDLEDGVFTPGTADVLLTVNIDTQDINEPVCLPWDGKDGNGADIDELGIDQIPLVLSYSQGIYHFPIYDAEILEQGIRIEAVRPPGPDPLLFYDDSNISAPSGTSEPPVNLNGCVLPCHTWTNYTDPNTIGFGNLNTINSWWFSQRQEIELIEPVVSFLNCSINGPETVCPGQSATLFGNLMSMPDPLSIYDSIGYQWDGPGITGTTEQSTVQVDQPGTYTLVVAYKNGPDRVCSTTCTFELLEDDACCELEVTCPDPFEGGVYECFSQIPPAFETIQDLIDEGLMISGDSCFPLLLTVEEEGDPAGDCTDTVEWTRIYRIYSDENNDMSPDQEELAAECSQLFFILDTFPPSMQVEGLPDGFENGDTLFVQCTPEGLGALPGFEDVTVTVTDGCGENIEAEFYDTLAVEGSCLEDGFLAFFECGWRATDACGNVVSFDFYVTLGDTMAPIFTRPIEDITLSCESMVPDLDTLGLVYEECSCAILEVDEIIFDQVCANFMIERIYTVSDHCGNTRTASQRISVIDDVPPEVIFYDPALEEFSSGDRIEVECDRGFFPDWIRTLDTTSVLAMDNCANTIELTFDFEQTDAGSCNEDGFILEYRATWTADDQCGNITTLFLDFVLVDRTPPEVLSTPEATCPELPDPQDIEVLDNCGVEIISVSIDSSGSVCSEGKSYVYTWEISDFCNNTTTFSRTYISGDRTPPRIVFTDPDLFDLNDGDTLVVDCNEWDEGFWEEKLISGTTYVDACSEDIQSDFSFESVPGNQCLLSGYPILWNAIWVATDECGNSTEFEIFIGAVDERAPEWPGFEPLIRVDCASGIPAPDVLDNCGGVQLDIQDSLGNASCPVIEVIFRTVVAYDMCGRSNSWEQVIEVVSERGPDFSNNDSLFCSPGLITPVASDPCTNEPLPVTILSDDEVDGCGGMVRRVVWTAQGTCSSENTFTQYYYDGNAIETRVVITSLNDLQLTNGDTIYRQCSDDPILYSDIALVDSCGLSNEFLVLPYPEDAICGYESISKLDRFEVFVTYDCGISDSLTFRVAYRDTEAPEFVSVPEDVTLSCEPDLNPGQVEVVDDCSQVSIEVVDRLVSQGDPEIIRRTWYATDLCGNQDSASQQITLSGDLTCDLILPPTIPCFKDSLWLYANVEGGVAPYDYQWSLSGGGCLILADFGDSVLIQTGYGGFEVELIITDVYGCNTRCEADGECILKKGKPGQDLPSSALFSKVEIYPNPADDMLFIQHMPGQFKSIQMFDRLGRLVLERNIGASNLRTDLDVRMIDAGLYFIRLNGDQASITKTVMLGE